MKISEEMQQQAQDLYDENGSISITYIQRKFKVTRQMAEQIFKNIEYEKCQIFHPLDNAS